MTVRDGYGILSHSENLSEVKADCFVFREQQQPVRLECGESVGGGGVDSVKLINGKVKDTVWKLKLILFT